MHAVSSLSPSLLHTAAQLIARVGHPDIPWMQSKMMQALGTLPIRDLNRLLRDLLPNCRRYAPSHLLRFPPGFSSGSHQSTTPARRSWATSLATAGCPAGSR